MVYPFQMTPCGRKMVIDDILKWAPDNEDVFKEILENTKKGCIIPFVGAGMSVPIYPLWRNVLEDLTKKISSDVKKNEIWSLINDASVPDAYTKAADKLIEIRTGINIFRDLLKIFNENKIDDTELRTMSSFLLPFLFPDVPVITTNYDRVLEHVYQIENLKFDGVFSPDSELAVMVGQQNLHCLFKIHGDIGRETIDSRKLILSGKSYDRVYYPNSELVNTLKTFFKGKIMLFLGCSLKNDRTLDILKQVAEMDMVSHYAILPSEKDVIDDNVRFFGDRGIRAIYYDPAHHESVKTILEELLRGTDPDKFRYFRSLSTNDIEKRKVGNPFVYNAGIIDFIGRKEETKELKRFADSEGDFKWWAIVGKGGTGKTRLVFEFTNTMRNEGWNIEWISRNDLKNISDLSKRLTVGRKNIVVADYGRSFVRELGRWMVGIANDIANRKNTSKIRVLIIEREQDERIGSFTSLLSEEDYNGRLKIYSWDNQFLSLKTLHDNDVRRIIRSYGLYRGKIIEDSTIEHLVMTLENVDPDFKRPLYAMFITDAYCENEDPTTWDKEGILEWVTDREDKIIASKIEECTGQNNTIQRSALKAIRFIATINGGISLEDLSYQYSEYWSKYERIFEHTANGSSLEECIEFVGIMKDGFIDAIRPDILGEFYILKMFKKHKELFVQNGWTDNENILSFIFRFAYYNKEQEEIIRTIFKMLSETIPSKKDSIPLYAMIIVNFTAILRAEDDILLAVELLKTIYKHNEETALMYAQGLANQLALIPTEEGVKELSEISEKYDEDEEIALTCARGIRNLNGTQPIERKKESVSLLGKLSERFKTNEVIAIYYAIELSDLCEKVPLKEKEVFVSALKDLSDRLDDNEEVAILCANSLNNLVHFQTTFEKKRSIEQLKHLSIRFEDNEEIAFCYANAIVNVINRLPLQEERRYVIRLAELSTKHESNIDIAVAYAKGLFNMGLDHPKEEKKKSVHILEDLCEKFDGEEEMAYQYAYALVNLTNDQSVINAERSVEQLKKLSEKYKDNNRIVLEYAYGLVNLLFKQSLEDAKESVACLQKLYERNEDSIEIATEYASGLYRLTIDHPFNDMQKTVNILKELKERYSKSNKINLLYSFGVLNLDNKNPLLNK